MLFQCLMHLINNFCLVPFQNTFIYFLQHTFFCRRGFLFHSFCSSLLALIHDLDIGKIRILFMQKQIGCQHTACQKLLIRICDRHGQAVCDRHGQKRCIDIASFRKSEGNIGKTTDGCQPLLLTVPDRFQCFKGCIFIGTDCRYQSVYHNIFFCKSKLQCSAQDLLNNFFLFIQILWETLVRYRKQDKHCPIFLCDLQEWFHLGTLHGNGIDQRPARIMPQDIFLHINMGGINAKWQACLHGNIFHDLQKRFLFINTAHTHIDIQNGSTAFLLLGNELLYHGKIVVTDTCLKLLFTGRIDPFSDNMKPVIQSECQRFPFTCQITDSFVLRCICRLRQFHCACLFYHGTDMLYCCTTAAAKECCPCFYKQTHLPAKGFRIHFINRSSLAVQLWQPCIRLCQYRDLSDLLHLPDNPTHLIRSCRTVRSDDICAKCL